MIGNYQLIIKFGGTVVPLSASILRELTIVQDLNKLVPEFRLSLDDPSGLMTHISPFDRNMSSVQIECAIDYDTTDKNTFDFLVYTREPRSDQSTPTNDYDVGGLLDVKKLFSPSFSRGFSGSVKTSLETVATEMDIDSIEIDDSLSYDKNLLQPAYNNAQFLTYHKNNLLGSNSEYGYKCFVKNYKNKKIFVFKSLTQMINDPVSHKFILNDTPYVTPHATLLPIYEYYIYDNYGLYGIFGLRVSDYSYFDYDTSTYTTDTLTVDDFVSLSDFFLIDKSDSLDNNLGADTGRTNDFHGSFEGKEKSRYGNQLINLTKLWITTQGIPNAVPGQTAKIFFPHGAAGGDLYSYQYSGYWLIERVVHNFRDAFLTKLLLTRHGLDTDKETSLLPATNKKQKP